jgi:hypothetical protein
MSVKLMTILDTRTQRELYLAKRWTRDCKYLRCMYSNTFIKQAAFRQECRGSVNIISECVYDKISEMTLIETKKAHREEDSREVNVSRGIP